MAPISTAAEEDSEDYEKREDREEEHPSEV
jgi:hypothetical protein